MAKVINRTNKRGKLKGDLNSIKLHEREAVEFLIAYGINVTIISARRDRKTPDFQINERHRELKTPQGSSPNNVAHAIKKGERQSEHLILDARHSPKSGGVFIAETTRAIQASSFIRTIWIILRSGQLVEIERKGLGRQSKK